MGASVELARLYVILNAAYEAGFLTDYDLVELARFWISHGDDVPVWLIDLNDGAGVGALMDAGRSLASEDEAIRSHDYFLSMLGFLALRWERGELSVEALLRRAADQCIEGREDLADFEAVYVLCDDVFRTDGATLSAEARRGIDARVRDAFAPWKALALRAWAEVEDTKRRILERSPQ